MSSSPSPTLGSPAIRIKPCPKKTKVLLSLSCMLGAIGTQTLEARFEEAGVGRGFGVWGGKKEEPKERFLEFWLESCLADGGHCSYLGCCKIMTSGEAKLEHFAAFLRC